MGCFCSTRLFTRDNQRHLRYCGPIGSERCLCERDHMQRWRPSGKHLPFRGFPMFLVFVHGNGSEHVREHRPDRYQWLSHQLER